MLGCKGYLLLETELNLTFEDKNAKRNAESGSQVHEVSEWDKDSVRHRHRCYPCGILATGLASFCLCPENLSEVELRDDGLVCVSEEFRMGKRSGCGEESRGY